jgi:hypothetical protein
MPSSISSSDRRFIAALLLWTALLTVAANLAAGYALRVNPWLKRRVEVPSFAVMANLEDYVRHYPDCPVVVLGSSIAENLPPAGWERPGVCSIALIGQGPLLGLETMARTEAAPRLLFIEASFGFRDTPPGLAEAATDPARRFLHAWFPLTTARGNWLNMLGKTQYAMVHELYRPAEPWTEWRAQHQSYRDVYIGIYGAAESDWMRGHLAEQLDRTKTLVAELERRGTKIIFFEPPLDRQIAALPIIALWSRQMRQAFADHEWVTDAPESYYLTDGQHFTPGSGKDFFDLLMRQVPPVVMQGADSTKDRP